MIEFIRKLYLYSVLKWRGLEFRIIMKLCKHGILNRADLYFATDRLIDAAMKLDEEEKGLK